MPSKTNELIHKAIREALGLKDDELNLNSHFEHDLNAGEQEMKEIITRLEEELDIEIGGKKFNTVKDLVDFVKDQLDEIGD